MNQDAYKQKSSAPLILGIVGFAVNIPGVLCTALCAAASSSAAGVIGSAGGVGGAAASATGSAIMLPVLIPWIGGFIASFFGKSSACVLMGIATIVFGVWLSVVSFMGGNWLWGIASSICYIVGGALAIANSGRR